MEKLDPNLETQVWRRIAAQPQPERGDLRPLLTTAWEQASVLRQLVPLLPGKQRERAKALSAKAHQSVEAIKGLLALSGQQAGTLRPTPIPKEPARRQLEKSFRRSRHLMTEYTARTIDPEFGAVYQALAERERENGVLLAELIGSVEL